MRLKTKYLVQANLVSKNNTNANFVKKKILIKNQEI